VKSEQLSGEKLLSILSIAHKYCMEKITQDVVEELKKATTYDGFVDLVVASQVIDSAPLYQDGMQRLISSGLPPNKEQSRRIGTDATHAVMIAVIGSLKASNAAEVASIRSEMNQKVTEANNEKQQEVAAALAKADNTKCRFCSCQTSWQCSSYPCRKRQTIQPT
jgi:hypothetical protein